ncbi:MAG: helix-turn-helix domain-containing protein [Planctomycetaceae bacterium]|nr:helix-turn-helix domain-containing protein [Planctomycetaceae bacterium]
MPRSSRVDNRIKQARMRRGWTQAQLAERAGISRTAVTAIEGERLVPSVAAALALAQALDLTVEELFGSAGSGESAETWAWESPAPSAKCWRAEVGGRTVLYPAGSTPMFTPLPDSPMPGPSPLGEETLVVASCDPAAGLLASQFASVTGLRLLVLPRSSRQAVEMLRDGLVHMAGLHLSTGDAPDRNAQVVREILGTGFQMLRIARWQEGIAMASSARLKSVRATTRARLTWIGREPGSGARQCLDRLLENRPGPRRFARHHRGVTEAVQSGWADAGICVQLASAEAGLAFLPVQEECYDLCFPKSFVEDRRLKAFLSVIRSAAYRTMLSELPGYSCLETGNLVEVT